MNNSIFISFLSAFANGDIDLMADGLMLTLHSDHYVPDIKATEYNPDTMYELPTGNGYIRGGLILQNKALTSDTTYFELKADNIDWAGATVTARYAILRDINTPNQQPIAFFDFGTNITSTDYFSIIWPDNVVMLISTEVLRLSSYYVWLDAGFTGTEADFLEYIKGPKGDPGPAGPAAGDQTIDNFVMVAGVNTYTLSGHSVQPARSNVYVNGIRLIFNLQYIISGNQITLYPLKMEYVHDTGMNLNVAWN